MAIVHFRIICKLLEQKSIKVAAHQVYAESEKILLQHELREKRL